MKKTGIICEYNPMHFGHIHQIKNLDNDLVIGLMSGSFVQRGEPAVIDKFTRAKLAIENGCDLILEMPQIISLQSSTYFAYGSVHVLNLIGINNLSFGYEGDIKEIKKIAEAPINEEKIKKYMEEGFSYKKAFIKTLDDSKLNSSIITANNTLAIDYIKSIDKINKDIFIKAINRVSSSHEDENIIEGKFQSSTAIRKLIYSENTEYENFLPSNVLLNLDKKHLGINSYYSILKYILTIEKRDISMIAGYEKGIENLLYSSFKNSENIFEVINLATGKRYSSSKIKRLLINILLGITFLDVENIDKIKYIKPLALNEKGKLILNNIKDDVIIVNKPKNTKMDKINNRFLQIDIFATELYNMFSPNKVNDFTNNPYIKTE